MTTDPTAGERVGVVRGWRTYSDGSMSPVERWVKHADGDWVSLDSTRRTSGDILMDITGVCECGWDKVHGPRCPDCGGATNWRAEHDCHNCPDCLHDGRKCCGCYDGACCKTTQTHTRTSTDAGPDYCDECSTAIGDWVPWPCPAILLDLDIPAYLVPSSTPGHSHLYIDADLSESDYLQLIDLLGKLRIIERGYASATKRHKATSLRLPWCKKGQTATPAPLAPEMPF